MANLIQNSGKWGPIEEAANTAGLTQKSWEGREIKFVFDNSTTTGIHYTAPIGLPLTSQTEFVWNNEAVDCENTADMTVYWQGTDDPSVAMAAYGNGSDITASDTGWTSVSISALTGSGDCDGTTSVNLDSVSNVKTMKYMRFKFVLATANPGDVTIACRVTNIPTYAQINYSTTLA